ncbi:MAG: nascent polypeptide-associated complex protein [Candidatus Diapherotrites archaeon]
MFPGMRNINPGQMNKMMQSLGIKSETIEAKRVIFEMEGKRLIIDEPNVSAIDMQGQKTYTVMGKAREEQAGVPDEDVEMVAQSAGVGKEKAKKALEETKGDIAEAINSLKGGK